MSRAIYSFPEPEKTSAWSNDERNKSVAKAPEFIDHELETAKKRTAEIKARMSPPGALGLPPLLEAQRLKYGITDNALRSQALWDRIHVFPIDHEEGELVEKTAGGLHKPNSKKLRDKQEGNRGVLISAGLTAMDRLMSHGVELGDIVVTNKNCPFARRCDELSTEWVYYLVMREADLASDETLLERIRRGEQHVMDAGGGDAYCHQLAINDNGEWVFRKKVSVYINDTW